MATYLSDTSNLDDLGTAPQVLQAQLAAAAEIDEAFRRAGYPTPVVTADVTNGDDRARLEARLAVTEEALAIHTLIDADVDREGEDTPQAKAYKKAQAWLANVAAGKAALPTGLARTRPTFGLVTSDADPEGVNAVLSLNQLNLQ